MKACRGLKLLLGLGALNLGICVVFPNCGLDVPIGDSRVLNHFSDGPLSSIGSDIDRTLQRHSTPKPESEWNELGLWRKISNVPATYVPKGYTSSHHDGPDGPDGTWFVDQRDGKRLFAPSSAHLGYSHKIWEAEARKITATEKVLR